MVYLGRDRLIGVPSTGGDSNVVVRSRRFSSQHGFTDGAINKPITTLNQILGLAASGDIFPPMSTGTTFSFLCSIVPQATYANGTPVSYPFP
jgi:hypothetical protein